MSDMAEGHLRHIAERKALVNVAIENSFGEEIVSARLLPCAVRGDRHLSWVGLREASRPSLP